MSHVVEQARKYFDRFPLQNILGEYDSVSSWKDIQKSLARVNIDSILVDIKIEQNSKLIFPFIVRHKENNQYLLVETLSQTGLVLSKKEISFCSFREHFENEFLILEKKPFIKTQSSPIQVMINSYWRLVNLIFITSLFSFIIIWFLYFESIVPILVSGFMLSWYYHKLDEPNGFHAPLCIENGIFSCQKAKLYTIIGISFSEAGLIYFLGSVLAISTTGVTITYLVATLLSTIFCLYGIYLQFFKEKKICIICSLISIAVFANTIISSSQFFAGVDIGFVNEIMSTASFIIVAFFFLLTIRRNDSNDRKKAKDFDKIMSEWPYVKSVSQLSNISLPNSDIIIGNQNAKNDIKLVLHMGCKHCPEALREMINLALLDDSFCLHLYIKADTKDLDQMYFNQILSACNSKDYQKLFDTFLNWKKGKPVKNGSVIDNKNLIEHQKLMQNNAISYFPAIKSGDLLLSTFPRFDNLKVAMRNY